MAQCLNSFLVFQYHGPAPQHLWVLWALPKATYQYWLGSRSWAAWRGRCLKAKWEWRENENRRERRDKRGYKRVVKDEWEGEKGAMGSRGDVRGEMGREERRKVKKKTKRKVKQKKRVSVSPHTSHDYSLFSCSSCRSRHKSAVKSSLDRTFSSQRDAEAEKGSWAMFPGPDAFQDTIQRPPL